ncbi:MAG: hypothetical protein IJ917_09850, partial [Firmicutes bacterium]|nr:hypothetical protein [Bacillota bacterium]
VVKQLETPVLKTAAQNGSGVEICWKAVRNAHKYRIYRKMIGGSWIKLADTKSTSYCDSSSLSKNTIYYYTVRAVSSDGKSFESLYDNYGVCINYNPDNISPKSNAATDYRNAVFFGDSWTYGAGAVPHDYRFATRLANALGLCEFNFGVRNSGFIIKTKPFSLQLVNAYETMTLEEREQTQYVFIVGGVNDVRHYGDEQYFNDYSAAVCDVCTAALEMFPNATIVLAQGTLIQSGGTPVQHEMIAYCDSVLDQTLMSDRVIRIMDPGLFLAKEAPICWRKDALHPSNYGHSLLASYIYVYTREGTMDINHQVQTMDPTSIVTAKTSSKLCKGLTHMYLRSGKYTIKKTIEADKKTKIGTIDAFCAPYETITESVKTETSDIGTITIEPTGSIYFTPDKSFTGSLTIPEISWEYFGEDNT